MYPIYHHVSVWKQFYVHLSSLRKDFWIDGWMSYVRYFIISLVSYGINELRLKTTTTDSRKKMKYFIGEKVYRKHSPLILDTQNYCIEKEI